MNKTVLNELKKFIRVSGDMTYYSLNKQIMMDIIKIGPQLDEAGMMESRGGWSYFRLRSKRNRKKNQINKNGNNSRDTFIGHSGE